MSMYCVMSQFIFQFTWTCPALHRSTSQPCFGLRLTSLTDFALWTKVWWRFVCRGTQSGVQKTAEDTLFYCSFL